MVLASAAAFGTLAIFAKLGYRASLNLYELLAYRFAISAAAMTVLALVAGESPFRLPRRRAVILLAMGIAYAGQSFSFFAALRGLSASLTELVLYTYPTLVAIAGWLLLKKPVRLLHVAALPISFIGVALLIGGGSLSPSWYLVAATGAPLIYTCYILVGDRVMPGTPPLAASATTVTGTGIVFVMIALATGSLAPPAGAHAWLVLGGLILVPTMLAITLFLAALPRVGGSEAALVSTFEPVVTVALATALLGEKLNPVQFAGAAFVLVAVLAIQWPERRRRG